MICIDLAGSIRINGIFKVYVKRTNDRFLGFIARVERRRETTKGDRKTTII